MTFNIETVGVIGAGQMGAGIAEVAAQAGMIVSLTDVAEERINAALATINGHLSRQVAKGQIDEAEQGDPRSHSCGSDLRQAWRLRSRD